MSAQHCIPEMNLEGLAKYILAHNIRKIVVLLGAGASTAAGIPDFRSNGTGIYSQLGQYGLRDPTQAFDLMVLREAPEIFYSICDRLRLWPGLFPPTHVHHFIRLLVEEGRLSMCCTQNIDGLERAAGIPEDLLVEAHGSFKSSRCIECHAPMPIAEVRRLAEEQTVPHCAECGGIVKPDVIFFGENLPVEYLKAEAAAREADMLLVIGTSLQVYPVASLVRLVSDSIPRVVLNRDRPGGRLFLFPGEEKFENPDFRTYSFSEDEDRDNSTSSGGSSSAGHDMLDASQYEFPLPRRDLFFSGDCQACVQDLAGYLGLGKRLKDMYDIKVAEIDSAKLNGEGPDGITRSK